MIVTATVILDPIISLENAKTCKNYNMVQGAHKNKRYVVSGDFSENRKLYILK